MTGAFDDSFAGRGRPRFRGKGDPGLVAACSDQPAEAAGVELKLVVVDYLQLLDTTSNKGNREQEVGETSRGLKATARATGVTLLVLSQLMGCALSTDVGGRGLAPNSFIHASPGVVEAKRKLALLERGLGRALPVLRAVILEDKSFSVIGMERYGCRARSWSATATDSPSLHRRQRGTL